MLGYYHLSKQYTLKDSSSKMASSQMIVQMTVADLETLMQRAVSVLFILGRANMLGVLIVIILCVHRIITTACWLSTPPPSPTNTTNPSTGTCSSSIR